MLFKILDLITIILKKKIKMFACRGKKKSQKISELIQNQNLLRLRLSQQEKLYYTNL